MSLYRVSPERSVSVSQCPAAGGKTPVTHSYTGDTLTRAQAQLHTVAGVSQGADSGQPGVRQGAGGQSEEAHIFVAADVTPRIRDVNM